MPEKTSHATSTIITAKKIAALITVVFYLGGLAAWVAGAGIPAWIVGLIIGVVSLIICLTSEEGSTSFTLTMILMGSSFVYLLLGGVIFFFDLRELFGA